MLEQDDMDNWGQSTVSGKGRIAQKFPNFLGMGKFQGSQHKILPGTLDNNFITEITQRSFYGRWDEMMNAANWSEIVVDF